MTGAPAVMVELAEYLTDLVSFADWAYFAKNGADVTNYATMIARDATGRKKIVMIQGGYHGAAPWMQVPGHHGLIEEDYHNIIRIKWNDIKAFEDAISENPNEIAGFIATPYHVPVFKDNEMPADGYWQNVEAICRQEGIVLVIDDIRHGFRLDMSGSNEYFGFKPDLLCLGKALANGHPISALLGTDALKNIAARVFYTGSFFFEAVPMAACLVNLKGLEEIQGPQIMQTQGEKLTGAMVDIATGYGFTLKVTGVPSMPYIRITDDESMMLHQDWCAECTRRGAYFTPHHNWFLSTAHTAQDIDQTLEIVDDAFKAVKKKWEDEKF
jgi:glutamate-1-semialdehyde 2,1-aminomutase